MSNANFLYPFTLLNTPDGTCKECAVKHDETQPHNQQSLHYQYYFYNIHGRWPSWKDAMSHCTDDVKKFWVNELQNKGVTIKED